jgi:hypothetical protein
VGQGLAHPAHFLDRVSHVPVLRGRSRRTAIFELRVGDTISRHPPALSLPTWRLVRHDVGAMNPPRPVAPTFLRLVRQHVEPIVAHAGFAWNNAQRTNGEDGWVDGVLYEADPDAFISRFPDLTPDYGDQPVPCIDLWIHYDVRRSSLRSDVDGIDVGAWLPRKMSVRGARNDPELPCSNFAWVTRVGSPLP